MVDFAFSLLKFLVMAAAGIYLLVALPFGIVFIADAKNETRKSSKIFMLLTGVAIIVSATAIAIYWDDLMDLIK